MASYRPTRSITSTDSTNPMRIVQTALIALVLLLATACAATGGENASSSQALPQTQSDSFDFVTFKTVDEMANASTLVLVGIVSSVDSIGFSDVGEDPNPTEDVAVVVEPEIVLKGLSAGAVSFQWPAFVTDGSGNRIFEMVNDGLPVPKAGDRLLLFLVDEDRGGASFFGKVSHRPVNSSGLAFVERDTVVLEAQSNGLEESLTGKPIGEIAELTNG